MTRVLVVSMPWCAASRPNLSAGVVKALAKEAGANCSVADANLTFAAKIGFDIYEMLAETSSLFGLCEHLFACDLFSPEALTSDEFLSRHKLFADPAIKRLRDETIPCFLNELTDEVLARNCDIVGFTCTFNQVFASLALASRLKAAQPATCIVFGGACVHGAMGEEYARAFDGVIDHVFLGEADESLPRFLAARSRSEVIAEIPGITVGGRATAQARQVRNMEAVPAPDYDDYFERRNGLSERGIAMPDVVSLPYESSRGCWWGEKQHCTFCGLNNQGMAFRSKSPRKIHDELMMLAERHGMVRFMAADNIITHKDFDLLVRELDALEGDFQLFYEIKANMKRDQTLRLARAGVRWVQPGIESFSDHMLKLMRKGTTALQNVQLLRLCAEFGITASYNILIGFPGETDADYAEMTAVMERIFHLTPPSGDPGLVQIHRFSPFFDRPDEFDFRNVRPAAYYGHLIPRGHADPAGIAYFFDSDLPAESAYARCSGHLSRTVADWRNSTSSKRARLGPGFLEVETREHDKAPKVRRLDEVESVIFVLSDRVLSVSSLVGELIRRLSIDDTAAVQAIDDLLSDFILVSNCDNVVCTVPYERPKTTDELTAWLNRYFPSPPGQTSLFRAPGAADVRVSA